MIQKHKREENVKMTMLQFLNYPIVQKLPRKRKRINHYQSVLRND